MTEGELSEADWLKFQAVVESKIAPNQATVDLLGRFQLNFGTDSQAAILAALRKQHVANLHFLETPIPGLRDRSIRARHDISIEHVRRND